MKRIEVIWLDAIDKYIAEPLAFALTLLLYLPVVIVIAAVAAVHVVLNEAAMCFDSLTDGES